VTSVASWISIRTAGRACRSRTRHRVVEVDARERARRRRAPDGLEGADDGGLHHVEHLLLLDECHLEVQLAELELPVGAQILVAPARRDLVVAVDLADHQQLLEELRRLREARRTSRLHRTGVRKSRAPSGVPRVMLGVQTSTKPRASIVRRMPAIASCESRRFAACGRGAGRASGT
jgi:hypothetical protein